MARPTESDSASPQLPTPAGARALRVGCVAATYHADLVGRMVASARRTLEQAGLAPADFVEVSVPGAFELPLVAQRMARRDDIDAVLTFGLILKGETEHDRHIAGAVAHALTSVGLETGTPVLFGVLTCSTLDQARARARGAEEGGLDKGGEVARAAIAVLHSLAALAATETAGAPEETR